MVKQFVMFRLAVCLFLLLIATAHGQEAAKATRRSPQPQVRYELGTDSLPQDGVQKGKLEGPFLFHSKIIENTVRRYWVHVPAQYDAEKPACVLVFQDGARAINPEGVIRVPQVLDNLIAKKQIPVTIGIFITPGHSEFFGEAKAENVRWEDDALKFDVTFSRDGNDFTFAYSGKPEDGKLAGSITSEFQGQKRETSFTAIRQE